MRPAFYFEVAVEPDAELQALFEASILRHLLKMNADFAEAWKEHPVTLVPQVNLYRAGEGPFSGDAGKIKQVCMLKSAAA